MFSNEASLPYLTKVEPITPICMGRILGELGRVKEFMDKVKAFRQGL